MYPDDCIQSIIAPSSWWVKNESQTLCRGSLVHAFVPHVDQLPYKFEPVGRKEATRHTDAIVRVEPLKVGEPLKQVELPVAAMPLHNGEVWAAYRAKRRPCLVIGSSSPAVDSDLTKGKSKSATAPTILVAPYYGADKSGTRAGYRPEFVERVRHCEYPQFVWDCLPISSSTKESILRLDHIQPIGAHYNAFKLSEFRLSDEALGIMDELIHCIFWGGIEKDGFIAMYREGIEATFGPAK